MFSFVRFVIIVFFKLYLIQSTIDRRSYSADGQKLDIAFVFEHSPLKYETVRLDLTVPQSRPFRGVPEWFVFGAPSILWNWRTTTASQLAIFYTEDDGADSRGRRVVLRSFAAIEATAITAKLGVELLQGALTEGSWRSPQWRYDRDGDRETALDGRFVDQFRNDLVNNNEGNRADTPDLLVWSMGVRGRQQDRQHYVNLVRETYRSLSNAVDVFLINLEMVVAAAPNSAFPYDVQPNAIVVFFPPGGNETEVIDIKMPLKAFSQSDDEINQQIADELPRVFEKFRCGDTQMSEEGACYFNERVECKSERRSQFNAADGWSRRNCRSTTNERDCTRGIEECQRLCDASVQQQDGCNAPCDEDGIKRRRPTASAQANNPSIRFCPWIDEPCRGPKCVCTPIENVGECNFDEHEKCVARVTFTAPPNSSPAMINACKREPEMRPCPMSDCSIGRPESTTRRPKRTRTTGLIPTTSPAPTAISTAQGDKSATGMATWQIAVVSSVSTAIVIILIIIIVVLVVSKKRRARRDRYHRQSPGHRGGEHDRGYHRQGGGGGARGHDYRRKSPNSYGYRRAMRTGGGRGDKDGDKTRAPTVATLPITIKEEYRKRSPGHQQPMPSPRDADRTLPPTVPTMPISSKMLKKAKGSSSASTLPRTSPSTLPKYSSVGSSAAPSKMKQPQWPKEKYIELNFRK